MNFSSLPEECFLPLLISATNVPEQTMMRVAECTEWMNQSHSETYFVWTFSSLISAQSITFFAVALHQVYTIRAKQSNSRVL